MVVEAGPGRPIRGCAPIICALRLGRRSGSSGSAYHRAGSADHGSRRRSLIWVRTRGSDGPGPASTTITRHCGSAGKPFGQNRSSAAGADDQHIAVQGRFRSGSGVEGPDVAARGDHSRRPVHSPNAVGDVVEALKQQVGEQPHSLGLSSSALPLRVIQSPPVDNGRPSTTWRHAPGQQRGDQRDRPVLPGRSRTPAAGRPTTGRARPPLPLLWFRLDGAQ